MIQIYGKKNYCKIAVVLFAISILTVLLPKAVQAASNLKLSYDKKTVSYTGKQVQAVIDGKTISMQGYPGIIINSTSMVPYDTVFQNGMKVSSSYNPKTKTIILKKFGQTVKLQVGSKTAYINGKKVTISSPPKEVTYVSKKRTKILVPTEFTARNLGYDFTFKSTDTNITTVMQSPMQLNYNGKWNYYLKSQAKIMVDNKSAGLDYMPGIWINDVLMVPASAVFHNSQINAQYQYKKESQSVTIKKEDIIIEMAIGSSDAIVNGEIISMGSEPLFIKNKTKGNAVLMVPGKFVAEQLGYSYQWDNKNQIVSFSYVRESEEYFNWTPKDSSFAEELQAQNKFQEIYDLLPDPQNTSGQNSSFISDNIGQPQEDTAHLPDGTDSQSIILNIEKNQETGKYAEQYIITAEQPFHNVHAERSEAGGSILLECYDMYQADGFYPFSDSYVLEAVSSYNAVKNITELTFSMNTKDIKYEISLSEDNKQLYLSLYPGYITEVSAGYEKEKEYLIIAGTQGFTPQITADEDYLTFEFENAINTLGVRKQEFSNGFALESVVLLPAETNKVQIVVKKKPGVSYIVNTKDNQCIITFQYNQIKIAVDCGHGANTPGKRTPPLPFDLDFDGDGITDAKKGSQIPEHTPDVGVGKYLVKELRNNGFEIYESAFGDRDIPLSERQKNIKEAGCDYSVSIHFNAFGDGKSFNDKKGFEVFYRNTKGGTIQSKQLADSICNAIEEGSDQINRGVHEKQLAICNTDNLGTTASVLVECEFMTNKEEVKNRVGNEEYWKSCASWVAKGICDYLNVTYIPLP